jgi:2-polyprenyl-3-methyl-5-hydroxy-6-metoxy-1,4-benzoquinol methylase
VLSRQDVTLAVQLILNREPADEAELAQLEKLGTLKALRGALMDKLRRAAPVFGEDAAYKQYRAPLFLLSPPDGGLAWQMTPPNLHDPVSQLCTNGQVLSEPYARICADLKVNPRPHRKQWEFVWIIACLAKAGVLMPGGKVVGFGCGREALPAFFASRGMDVLATDAPPEVVKGSWARGQQYTSDIDALYKPHLLPRHLFDQRVTFRHADMNAIPEDITGYDACWSACALEHLGSLQHGLDFIRNSLNTLRPGGVAVHTTEFNLSSDEETFEHPRSSIYRKKDIVGLLQSLREAGHDVWPLNLHPGDSLLDEVIDLPPNSPVHLKLALRRFVSTSIGIVVRRGGVPG